MYLSLLDNIISKISSPLITKQAVLTQKQKRHGCHHCSRSKLGLQQGEVKEEKEEETYEMCANLTLWRPCDAIFPPAPATDNNLSLKSV